MIEEILDPVIKNALLSNVMTYTGFGKSKIFPITR